MTGSPPNVVFVICHDLGKHLNCYGAEGVPSPNLDRFAAEGVLFTNTFCSSPCCSPSRGCVMSGQYAHTSGLMGLVNRGWSMPAETKLVFPTDHGIANMRSKGWLYDRGVEIALMMQMPGTIGQGMKVDHLIQNIDLAPTLLDAAGIKVPASMQGKSFWPLLAGGEYEPHEAIVVERNWHGNWDPTRAVRTPRYHYIRSFGENPKKPWLPGQEPYMNESFEDWFNELWPPLAEIRPEEELFDVRADPDEFIDLAQDPDYATIREELATYLDRWMHETGDPILHGPVPELQNPWPSIAQARKDR